MNLREDCTFVVMLLTSWLVFLLVTLKFCQALIEPSDNGGKQWIHYSCQELLAVRDNMSPTDVVFTHLEDLQDEYISRERYKPKRRRGKRAGVRVRTRKRLFKPPLPTVMFGNVRSLRNKIDEFTSNCKFNSEFRDSSMICLTETWLEQRDADSTMQVDNYILVRGDRSSTNKHHGGGVCLYVNERWCKNVTMKSCYCDDNVELLTVSCRPFYLPREFNNINLSIAYVPPSGDYNLAAESLINCISTMDDSCPNGINILLGDFNGCDINDMIPRYHQYVKCATRGDRTLDLLYCNIKDAYKVIKRPPLGISDHNMLYAMPTYRQKIKTQDSKQIQVRDWSDENLDSLRACYDCTDWDVLYDCNASLDQNVEVCSSYMKFCIDLIIPIKCVTVFPNNKPWVTKDVKEIINRKKSALCNDRSQLKEIQKELTRKITHAKSHYKDKVENLFKSNNSKDAWKGLKKLGGYESKSSLPEPENVMSFVNDLNKFYARFDSINFSDECAEVLRLIDNRHCENIVLSNEDVLAALNTAKTGKAFGPDRIYGKVVKSCKRELVKPMKRLFQFSLDKSVVPTEWKTSEIVPAPKCKIPIGENDLRPIALTSVLIKCFEVIVKKSLSNEVKHLLHILQFAYKEKRCVDDAITILLENVGSHLDKSKTYSRILFIDFSSAFNTIQPHILLRKLYNMGVNSYLIKWIYSYLTERPQFVRFNGIRSDVIVTNTGAPQGCVLSPILFTLYTNDCVSSSEGCTILKYADDTVIIGNISENNEAFYFQQVSSFVNWCEENFLHLNVKKTMEMCLDFRKDRNEFNPLSIKNENVKVVNSYKYLGVIIDDKLSFSENVQHLYKKSVQRVHHLRILNNLKIDSEILSLFYKSIIESVMSFAVVTWFGSCTKKDQKKLCKVIRIAKRMGVNTTSLIDLYNEGCLRLTKKIIEDVTHPLNHKYKFMRSGSRLCVPSLRTSRYSSTFVPSSMKIYNHFSGQR